MLAERTQLCHESEGERKQGGKREKALMSDDPRTNATESVFFSRLLHHVAQGEVSLHVQREREREREGEREREQLCSVLRPLITTTTTTRSCCRRRRGGQGGTERERERERERNKERLKKMVAREGEERKKEVRLFLCV